MSLYDYETGLEIESEYGDDEFYGVIQGAMRLADTDNLAKLQAAFPEQWKDLHARYNAPGGRLPDDPEPVDTTKPIAKERCSDCDKPFILDDLTEVEGYLFCDDCKKTRFGLG